MDMTEERSQETLKAIDAELRTAFDKFGATSLEMRDAKSNDPLKACDRLQLLGARSDLLRIVGSIGDSMSDEDALQQLQMWNQLED